MKTLVWAGLIVGSTVGGFVPTLWGVDFWSVSSILFSLVGGLLGIWTGYKIGQNYL